MNIEQEFKLLSEYMHMYIQIVAVEIPLPSWNSRRYNIPTFEEFKNNYELYGKPNFKQSFRVCGGELCLNHTQGLGTTDGVAVRYFNYHNSHKIFINDFEGSYTINPEQAVKLVQNCINNY